MRILLTGGTGMVGKNILCHQKSEKHLFFSPNHSELDLLNPPAVESYIAITKPDVVIHCAGKVGGIQANMREPVAFLVQNLEMGKNLVLAARKNKVPYFLNMGSSCMYPRDCANPIKEEMVLKGELEPTNEGYAIAKVAVARLCEYISREDSRFLYKTLIPCNLYGAYDKFGEHHSHMIPAVIKKLHEAQKLGKSAVDIWGDGQARREFMLAEDLADLVFYALENFEKMPAYLNVGLGHDYTINEYYQVVADVVGFKGQFEHDLSKPVGMKQKLVDTTRLAEFGWKYKTSLKDGLVKTYNYYLNEVLK